MNKILLTVFLMIGCIAKTVAMDPAQLNLSDPSPKIRQGIYCSVVEKIANRCIGRNINLNPVEFYRRFGSYFGEMYPDIERAIRSQSIAVWNKADRKASVVLKFNGDINLSCDNIPAGNIHFVRLPSNLRGQTVLDICVTVWGRKLKDGSPSEIFRQVALNAGNTVAVDAGRHTCFIEVL